MLRRDLRQYIIPGSDELLYIPGFITEDEELYIFKKVKHSQLLACIFVSHQLEDRRYPRSSVEVVSKSKVSRNQNPISILTQSNFRLQVLGITRYSPSRNKFHS
jgi:hypothetical protein